MNVYVVVSDHAVEVVVVVIVFAVVDVIWSDAAAIGAVNVYVVANVAKPGDAVEAST